MPSELLSRKFLLAAASLVSLSVLTWFGKIADGVYATGLVATVGAYLTANVAQKKNG
jgi:hypothetical protein